MEESILKKQNKLSLKNMALDKGLTRKGFNGKTPSKMLKQDFIEFILRQNHNNQNRQIDSDESSLEDIFQELMLSDLNPIFQFFGAINAIEGASIHVFNRTNSNGSSGSSTPLQKTERVAAELDEVVPQLTLQDEIKDKHCDIGCKCEICQKNTEIIEENIKVKSNIHDLEAKISCVVCHCNVRNVIFSPCNHLATCISCSKNPLLNKKCPLCRKVFDTTTRIFC